MMRAHRDIQLTCTLICLLIAGTVSAEVAKTTPPTAAKKQAAINEESLQLLRAKLDSADATSVSQALTALADLGGDAAAEAVMARLHRGLPPLLIENAIDSLVLLGRPVAAPTLLELTQHRRTQIRIKAILALGALKARSAQSALLYALDDPSPEVRGAAVTTLASVGNARAVPALFTAAERGVTGAWQALGQLAGPADLQRLLTHVNLGDVTPLRPALDGVMQRPSMPLETKLHLVQELERLASPSARACLVEWLAAAKEQTPARVRQSLFDSIKRLDHGQSALAKAPAPAPDPAAAKRAPAVSNANPSEPVSTKPAQPSPHAARTTLSKDPRAATLAEVVASQPVTQ